MIAFLVKILYTILFLKLCLYFYYFGFIFKFKNFRSPLLRFFFNHWSMYLVIPALRSPYWNCLWGTFWSIFTDLHSGLNFSAGWPHPLPSHTSRFIIIQCCFILQDMSNLRTWILPALFIDAFLLLKKSTLHLVCVQKYIWVILLNDRATIFPGTGFKSLFSYQVWDKLLFLYYLPHKALCMKRLFTL